MQNHNVSHETLTFKMRKTYENNKCQLLGQHRQSTCLWRGMLREKYRLVISLYFQNGFRIGGEGKNQVQLFASLNTGQPASLLSTAELLLRS